MSLHRAGVALLVLAWCPNLGAQNLFSYEDRLGPGGHTLVVDGKSFGPYRDPPILAVSTSGTAGAFIVVKRERPWVLAQGRETGPLPTGFEVDRLQVSDDGRVWMLTATHSGATEFEPSQTLLWVNGKTYGPYPELTTIEYAETGGSWIAAVRTAEDEAQLLVTGRAEGPFFTIDHAWMSPDGRSWGYAASDSAGASTLVTSDEPPLTFTEPNFAALYPREPHWGYAVKTETGQRIVVDGRKYEGYEGFRTLLLTPSGGHWGFEALKGNQPVVVIDGKEHPGEDLSWSRLGSQETFTWTVRDGSRVNVQSLKLP